MKKSLKLFFIGLFILFVLVSLIFTSLLAKQINYPLSLFAQTIFTAIYQSDKLTGQKNILLLGVDPRSDWLETNLDSDTIILVNLNFDTHQVKLLSLPRDLWWSNSQTRINKLYQLSLDNQQYFTYLQDQFQQLSGQLIDHTIVVTTDILPKLLTFVGPVTVEIDYSINDTTYPNPLYITEPQNNHPQYITVEFDQGKNTIDKDNVEFFVRSRKGANGSGADDGGRTARQRLLIVELVNQIIKQLKSTNLSLIPGLYSIWANLDKNISDQQLITYLVNFIPYLKSIQLTQIEIPIGHSKTDQQGIIYHPSVFTNSAWIYLPIDNDYQKISDYIDDQLK